MNKGSVIRTQSLRWRGAYPRKQGRLVAKLGLSVAISLLSKHRICSWAPALAASAKGAGVQQNGCRTPWLQDPLAARPT